MNKFRSLLTTLLAVIILVSCSDDSLENRIDKVEGSLGTNEPLKVDFSTKNSNDIDIINKRSYLFKSGDNDEAIWDNGNGTFYVYVERFGDVEWYEGAWIEFEYNEETKEVTNASAGTYFYNQFGNYESLSFNDNNDANSVQVDVNTFNSETGKISVNVTASSEAAYSGNRYEGKPMNLDMSFRGKLRVFEGGN